MRIGGQVTKPIMFMFSYWARQITDSPGKDYNKLYVYLLNNYVYFIEKRFLLKCSDERMLLLSLGKLFHCLNDLGKKLCW